MTNPSVRLGQTATARRGEQSRRCLLPQGDRKGPEFHRDAAEQASDADSSCTVGEVIAVTGGFVDTRCPLHRGEGLPAARQRHGIGHGPVNAAVTVVSSRGSHARLAREISG